MTDRAAGPFTEIAFQLMLVRRDFDAKGLPPPDLTVFVGREAVCTLAADKDVWRYSRVRSDGQLDLTIEGVPIYARPSYPPEAASIALPDGNLYHVWPLGYHGKEGPSCPVLQDIVSRWADNTI